MTVLFRRHLLLPATPEGHLLMLALLCAIPGISCDSYIIQNGVFTPCPLSYNLTGTTPDSRLITLDDGNYLYEIIGPEPVTFGTLPSWLHATSSLSPGSNVHAVTTLSADADAPLGTHSVGPFTIFSSQIAYSDACEDVTVTVTANGSADFSIAASGDVEIGDGDQGEVTVTITRLSGFDGAVDLSLNNLPAGISGVFVPTTIQSGATESILTLMNNGAVPGGYQIQIVGTANNGSVATEDYAIMATKAVSAGWHVVQEVSDVGQFVDLDCPSSSVCYAVGSASGGGPAAYMTTNGGQSWTSLSNLGVTSEAYAVQFLDEMTGYIGGFDLASETNGYLLKTTNGGTSWTNVGANMPTNLAVRALHFFDANSGYAAGGANAPSDTTKVMYTADGGANWTGLPWTGFSSHVVLRLYFWSINEGYVNVDTNSGQSPTFHTTDGGQNWILSTGFSGWFTDVSGGLGVAGTNTLFSASSPGANWSTEAIPGGTAFGVTTLGNRTWVAGRSGGAFVAFKEGGVWTTDWNAAVGEADELYDIEMFSNTEGVAIGRNFMARRIPE